VVDPTTGNRIKDRFSGRSVPHAVPRHQQPALCVRVQVTRLVQQLAAGHTGEPLSCKYQGDLLAFSR
jgi:hypothetical protein